MSIRTERIPNRLAREKSPYLLQHAHNPVDWYPWGDEAFEKARLENKPVFLSIGYSTCHWCHVMERESFENEAVAELLNRWFVPVKVDREERPDVDRLYMTAMQAMGMGGGWPLNAFLTPDLEPFYGGTYFPPDGRFGRPGMMDVLPRIHEIWTEQRDQVAAQGVRVLAAIEAAVADRGREVETPGPAELIERCAAVLARACDPENGGFGGAPKFPSPANLVFLLRASFPAERRERAVRMAFHQLDAMRAGGIHDHLGGGFHRYATDARWLVPHFEKMLYDQALIAGAYLDAVRIARRPGPLADPQRARDYAATARGIFGYVDRDLSAPGGGFCCAEDADSEGEEGKFFVWRPEEIAAALGGDAELFSAAYGVTEGGNFEHGTTILHLAATVGDVAGRFGLAEDEVARRLEAGRARLLEIRERRIRPHRDDKVLVAWNGLMIAAFARGARVLDDPGLASRAARAAEFVWKTLRNPASGALRRRWRDDEAAGDGQLDDHADLAYGMLELYGATFDPLWIERAVALVEMAIERFWDDDEGGFFESPASVPWLRIRMKDDYDGAELAGNSVMGGVLHTLAVLLDRDDWRRRAERLFAHFAARLAAQPVAMPQLLVAMDAAAAAPRHIVVAGRRDSGDTRALLAEVERWSHPRDVVLLAFDGEDRERLTKLAPFTAALAPRDGRATAFVCENYACRLPVSDPEELARQLQVE